MDRTESLLASFDQSARDAVEIARSQPFNRRIYQRLESQLLSFIERETPRPTWIIMPGLRGVGKTTLLAQLYNHPRLAKSASKFYLSFDGITNRRINYQDITDAIESRLGHSLYDTDDRVFVFLDEVHFLGENWDLNLKVLYDKYRHLFLACTGSSALALNITPDSARRADIVRIPPLSLAESMILETKVRQGQTANPNIKVNLAKISHHFEDYLNSSTPRQLEQALFASADFEDLELGLAQLKPAIDACWSVFNEIKNEKCQSYNPNNLVIESYINHYLTMPYAVEARYDFPTKAKVEGEDFLLLGLSQKLVPKQQAVENELQVKGQINQTMGLVLERDFDAIHRFDPQTKSMVFDFLGLLANSDTISLKKINQHMSEDRGPSLAINTIRDLLKTLRQAEILNEIRPLSSGFGRTAKPSKYLFSTPALRAALSPLVLIEDTYRTANQPKNPKYQLLRGRLLEDAVGMYLKRLFVDPPMSSGLEYDAQSGAADLVVTRINQNIELIPIEVGWNKQTHAQVSQTKKGLKHSPYGLVITGGLDQPRFDKQSRVAYIPLSTFLLI